MQFKVGDHDYITQKMDAVLQWNVARRIGPVIAELAPLLSLDVNTRDLIEIFTTDVRWGTEFLKNVTREVAKMSDEDTLYVFSHTLSRVDRGEKNPNSGDVVTWSTVWNTQAKTLQYSDITMPQMIQLVWMVLSENMKSFFLELQSNSVDEA